MDGETAVLFYHDSDETTNITNYVYNQSTYNLQIFYKNIRNEMTERGDLALLIGHFACFGDNTF